MNIVLGKSYREVITGFTGVAAAHVRYLTGCDQIALAPGIDKDGKLKDVVYFDWTRLEETDAATIKLPGAASIAEKPGGPNCDAPSPRA